MNVKLIRDMSYAEIESATDNEDVDWGYIDCGKRSVVYTLWRRLHLSLRIVGRINHADFRTGPLLAWKISAGIWPWREHVRAWGIVDDRRLTSWSMAAKLEDQS